MTDTTSPTTTERPKGRPGRPRKRGANGIHRYVPITVSLDPDLIERLDERAEIEQLEGRSEIIRRACREHLRRLDKREKREEE